MNKQRILYIAGPMSGIVAFNFPAFDLAAERLRAKGHVVVSPAELDDPAVRAEALASPDGLQTDRLPKWGELLSRDVRVVADHCNGIVLLPGWEKSRGARLEAYVGILCGHDLYEYDGRYHFANLIPVTHADVRAKL